MPIKCIPRDERPVDQPPIEQEGGRSWRLTVFPFNVTVPAFDGQSILEACCAHAIPLEHSCGGHCACSSCHVLVRQGWESLSAQDEDEASQLEDIDEASPQSRLGCQAQVYGDLDIEIPRLDSTSSEREKPISQ